MSSATTYKRRFAETHTEEIFMQATVWKLSVDIRSTISRKTWMGDREKNLLSVNWMDKQPVAEALMPLISCGCKANCATTLFLYDTR